MLACASMTKERGFVWPIFFIMPGLNNKAGNDGSMAFPLRDDGLL